ncbi:MAG: response regulator transcription factor [Saprospiraceae bacterium]|nr:response regulator transcription factor [Saprospiraceae bacterium]
MKRFWSNIALYGLSLGLLLVSLQFFRYKWIFVRNQTEWYAGAVALVFCIAGIWLGTHWKQQRFKTLPVESNPIQPPSKILEQLGITPREFEVLQLIAQGHSNQEIADQLYVSLNTIKTHISNLFSKLDADRRTQAIKKAKTLGLIP